MKVDISLLENYHKL